MAMTDEELLLQMNILASKTDSTTNPNMVYKTNGILNKALNPDLFPGNDSKIVNAINKLAESINSTKSQVMDLGDKVNGILLDTSDYTNQTIWEEVQALMDEGTIIEGLKNLLEGNRQEQVLGLTVDDIGKVLSVAQDENGQLITKAIDISGIGGSVTELPSDNVTYNNEIDEAITNVGEALDYLFINVKSGDMIDSIPWEKISNPPEIASGIELSDEALVLKSETGEMSSVPLVSDEDVNNIVNAL